MVAYHHGPGYIFLNMDLTPVTGMLLKPVHPLCCTQAWMISEDCIRKGNWCGTRATSKLPAKFPDEPVVPKLKIGSSQKKKGCQSNTMCGSCFTLTGLSLIVCMNRQSDQDRNHPQARFSIPYAVFSQLIFVLTSVSQKSKIICLTTS